MGDGIPDPLFLPLELSTMMVSDVNIIPAIAVVACTLLWLVYRFSFTPKSKMPAVQGGLPFFGQVFTMIKGSPWDTMDKWVSKYGTMFTFHLFGSDAICVSDPDCLKVILQTKLSMFKKDVDWTYKPFMVLLGNGLVTAEGHSWRSQRTLLANHLKFDILEEVPQMALEAVMRLCTKLDAATKSGEPVDMAEEFRHMTLQVIAKALLSLAPEESDQTFAHMYLPIVEEGNLRTWHPERMYLPTPSWFKFRRDVERLNSYVEGLIEARRTLRAAEKTTQSGSTRHQDVLDKMLSSLEGSAWTAHVMTQVRDGIKTFVLAGHETSASMLTWALFELSLDANSSATQQMLEEAARVFANSKDATGRIVAVPGREAINAEDGLNYSECCLRESLRKYSVVPTVVRVAVQDVEVEQYSVRRGSTLMINIQGVHHNPAYWPSPYSYQPERFMRPESIKPYTFLPFIEGPRMCLGQYLSLLESKIVLSVLLATYRFEVVNVAEASQKHAFMVPIIPKAGHFMKVHKR